MPTPSDKHAEIAPEHAAAALAALMRGARAARTRADGLQAVLDHAAVELMLWQEGFRPGAEGRDTRRAELFDLGSRGMFLRLAIGGGRCVAEVAERKGGAS